MSITEQQAEKLYHAVNALLLDIGMSGRIRMERDVIEDLMGVLFEIDGGVYRGSGNQ